MSLSVICIELRITLVNSFCNVVEFEFCVIFVCYALSISLEVKFSVSDFDGYERWGLWYFYAHYIILGLPGGQRKFMRWNVIQMHLSMDNLRVRAFGVNG